MAKVKIEGNTLDLPDEIAKGNKSLIDALTPFYPAAANATIKREQKKGGDMIVTVTKKAGTKGITPPRNSRTLTKGNVRAMRDCCVKSQRPRLRRRTALSCVMMASS